MVAHPREFSLPPDVASRVKALESVTAIADALEPVHLGRREIAFCDVSGPSEAYDLRFDGCAVGAVLRDDTALRGLPSPAPHWVLVQKDADLVLAARDRDEAIARARSLTAARLTQLPVRGAVERPARSRAALAGRIALGALAGALVSLLVRRLRTN